MISDSALCVDIPDFLRSFCLGDWNKRDYILYNFCLSNKEGDVATLNILLENISEEVISVLIPSLIGSVIIVLYYKTIFNL